MSASIHDLVETLRELRWMFQVLRLDPPISIVVSRDTLNDLKFRAEIDNCFYAHYAQGKQVELSIDGISFITPRED